MTISEELDFLSKTAELSGPRDAYYKASTVIRGITETAMMRNGKLTEAQLHRIYALADWMQGNEWRIHEG